jgi:O-phosphoseryl-tRNA(Cys) synthetase
VDHAWVPAAPFRAHLRLLLDDSGLPWPVMAMTAGVSTRLVGRLLGVSDARRLPKLPRDSAMRLFCLSDDRLAELARTRVPAADTQRELAELLSLGCRPADLARYCRLSLAELDALPYGATCTELTALLMRSARLQYQQW